MWRVWDCPFWIRTRPPRHGCCMTWRLPHAWTSMYTYIINYNYVMSGTTYPLVPFWFALSLPGVSCAAGASSSKQSCAVPKCLKSIEYYNTWSKALQRRGRRDTSELGAHEGLVLHAHDSWHCLRTWRCLGWDYRGYSPYILHCSKKQTGIGTVSTCRRLSGHTGISG